MINLVIEVKSQFKIRIGPCWACVQRPWAGRDDLFVDGNSTHFCET